MNRSDLAGRFGRMDDHELLRRYRSGDMTELAREVALAELIARGLAAGEPERPGPAADEDRAGSYSDLRCLGRFHTPIEAHVLRALLDAEGIFAVAGDANMVQAQFWLSNALGGVRVMVRQDDLERARALLAAFERGEYALDDGD